MQKVEGSSPFIRLQGRPWKQGLFVAPAGSVRRWQALHPTDPSHKRDRIRCALARARATAAPQAGRRSAQSSNDRRPVRRLSEPFGGLVGRRSDLPSFDRVRVPPAIGSNHRGRPSLGAGHLWYLHRSWPDPCARGAPQALTGAYVRVSLSRDSDSQPLDPGVSASGPQDVRCRASLCFGASLRSRGPRRMVARLALAQETPPVATQAHGHKRPSAIWLRLHGQGHGVAARRHSRPILTSHPSPKARGLITRRSSGDQ